VIPAKNVVKAIAKKQFVRVDFAAQIENRLPRHVAQPCRAVKRDILACGRKSLRGHAFTPERNQTVLAF
jgi:hypothetical protein